MNAKLIELQENAEHWNVARYNECHRMAQMLVGTKIFVQSGIVNVSDKLNKKKLSILSMLDKFVASWTDCKEPEKLKEIVDLKNTDAHLLPPKKRPNKVRSVPLIECFNAIESDVIRTLNALLSAKS